MSEKKRTNKGWANLRPDIYGFGNMDKEKLREVSRKGAEKTHQIVRERKTAQQCLADILSLEATPDIVAGADLDPVIAEQLKQYAGRITLYDLVNLVATGAAIGGNMRAAEYIRDTYGDMPTKQVRIDSDDIMTPEDRLMIQQLYERLESTDIAVVADMTTEDNTAALSDKAAAGQEDNRKISDNESQDKRI